MICKPDGTPYTTLGSRQQFDDSAPEHALFNQWDQEAIRMGGTPIYYYEMFISSNTIDPMYLEARGKLFSNNPVELWGLYEPIPAQNAQTAFGIDAPDEMTFEFNYRATLDAIGYPPKIGSRLFTPFLKENWVIIQRALGEFKMWGVVRLNLICQRYQESTTTGEGKIPQKDVDYKIV